MGLLNGKQIVGKIFLVQCDGGSVCVCGGGGSQIKKRKRGYSERSILLSSI